MVIGSQERREIEEIIRRTGCPRNFECYASQLETLCRVVSFADGQMIECMELRHEQCIFRVPFGWGHVCTCPVRKYIAAKFGR